jgi:CRP-like cAMP-binding protein
MVPLEILKAIHFLHDLPDAHLQELASVAEVVDYPDNSVLFREGQARASIYLIVDGKVRVEIPIAGKTATGIQTVAAGDLLSWSPLLGSGRMTATARTLSPVQAVVLNAAQVLAICQHNTAFGFEFMRRVARVLAQRLEGTRLQLLDVYRLDLPMLAEGEQA